MSTGTLRPYRLTPQTAGLLVVALAAWLVTVYQARAMGVMGGTMGLPLSSFLGLWTLMMAAMMLPSVAPLASMYARFVRSSRAVRLGLFGGGYLLVWAGAGISAFLLASLAGSVSRAYPGASTVVAAGIFAWCGLYQLTPLKRRCLTHCRSPLSLLLRYGSYRGALRDLRAGAHHGAYCLGCCWSLLLLLIAFGIMNIPAMVVLASVVLVEKLWTKGETFSRSVAAAAFGLAIAVLFFPDLAPGLISGGQVMGMR